MGVWLEWKSKAGSFWIVWIVLIKVKHEARGNDYIGQSEKSKSHTTVSANDNKSLNIIANSHINSCFRLLVSFRYFESQKYYAVEILEASYLRQKSNLEKLLFNLSVKYICHGVLLFAYFYFETACPKKADFFLCRRNMCWFNRTVQQNGAKNAL